MVSSTRNVVAANDSDASVRKVRRQEGLCGGKIGRSDLSRVNYFRPLKRELLRVDENVHKLSHQNLPRLDEGIVRIDRINDLNNPSINSFDVQAGQ